MQMDQARSNLSTPLIHAPQTKLSQLLRMMRGLSKASVAPAHCLPDTALAVPVHFRPYTALAARVRSQLPS